MSFGDELESQFDLFTTGWELNEVELFTKLQDTLISLSSKYPKYVSTIIHGAKSFVDFQVNSTYVKGMQGKSATRELSDLMFIVISPNREIARMCFMQNKVLLPNKYSIRTPCPFSGDLLQLDLLKERPEFVLKKRKSRILKDALLPSIGSYGVFYVKDLATCTYGMKYFSANMLEPRQKSGKSEKRQIKFCANTEGATNFYNREIQIDSCSDLKSFGDSLIDMKIGNQFSIYKLVRDLGNHQIAYSIQNMMRTSDRNYILDYPFGYDDNDDNLIEPKLVVIINADSVGKKDICNT